MKRQRCIYSWGGEYEFARGCKLGLRYGSCKCEVRGLCPSYRTTKAGLSKRAIELLFLVKERTEKYGHYCPMAGDSVSGPGDASCLLGLERRGFLKKERTSDYSYSITLAGELALGKAN